MPNNISTQPKISRVVMTSPSNSHPANAPKIASKLIKIAAVDGSAYRCP